MVSAVLPKSDRISDEDERGSGRFSLTGDHANPRKNLARTRVRQMAPDELKSAGYRDGLRSAMSGIMSAYPDYLQGFRLGYQARTQAA